MGGVLDRGFWWEEMLGAGKGEMMMWYGWGGGVFCRGDG